MKSNSEINDLIKNLIKEVLYNSLAQAIIKIIKSPHVLIKILLLICVLVSSSLASYMVIQSIITYLSYEVTTTSRIIHETPTVFPKITICNGNMFQTELALDYLKVISTNTTGKIKLFDGNQTKRLNYESKKMLALAVLSKAISISNSDQFNDTQRKQLGHDLDDILIGCQFIGKTCSSNDFIWKFDSFYGNCYVFNSGFDSNGNKVSLKTTTTAGWFFGLKLDFYVNYNEHLSLINSIFSGLGAIIHIENSSYSSKQSMRGIQLASGFRTFLSVDRMFKHTLPKPYSNCEINENSPKTSYSDLYDLIANSSYEYTQELCFEQCLQKAIIKECKCSFSYVFSLFNVETCITNSQINCSYNFFMHNYIMLIQDTCIGLCPTECNATIYQTTSNYNRLKGDLLADYINQNARLSSDFLNKTIDSETASKSVVSVNIFYESLSYKITTESPKMDLVSLLASIGGNLGLFLGVSLFSLCEMIQVLIEIYFIKMSSKKIKA